MSATIAWPAPTHDTVKARLCRLLAPGLGYCLRCGMPWSRVEGHVTRFNTRDGCFPLCEGCWDELGHPEARIEYYGALLDIWNVGKPVSMDTRNEIAKAVAAEPVTR